MDSTTIPELVTLVVCVVVFDQWERRRPSRPLDRRRTLSLDLFALAVVAVFGTLAKQVVQEGYEALGVSRALVGLEAVRHWPSPIKVLLGIVVADFALYWVHRWMHTVPLLWRTHRFHHTIDQLYWLSGARTSVVHLLLFAIPQVLIAHEVLALTPPEAAVAFSIGVVVNLWVHLNIDASFGPLDGILITPAYHRLHHARDILPAMNHGFLLAIWDRLFGTWMDPKAPPANYPLGLAGDEAIDARTVIGY